MNESRRSSEGLLDEDIILKHLEIRRGHIILDAGCGNGYMAKKFAVLTGDTGKVYALDPDASAIGRLREEVKRINIEAFAGDITRTTGIAQASVDLVYLSTVFHIFSDHQIEGFEKEVRRILKPGAALAIVNIKKDNTPFGPPVEMRSSPEELRHKLSFIPGELFDVGEHFYMHTFKNERHVPCF